MALNYGMLVSAIVIFVAALITVNVFFHAANVCTKDNLGVPKVEWKTVLIGGLLVGTVGAILVPLAELIGNSI